jgi:ABC-type amino acid transport substrate-binding protein
VKQRGTLVCGVSTGFAGFSAPDSQGNFKGLDVAYCRALAAGVLGDPNKVRYVALTAQNRFTALQSGEIDVLYRKSPRDSSTANATSVTGPALAGAGPARAAAESDRRSG